MNTHSVAFVFVIVGATAPGWAGRGWRVSFTCCLLVSSSCRILALIDFQHVLHGADKLAEGCTNTLSGLKLVFFSVWRTEADALYHQWPAIAA